MAAKEVYFSDVGDLGLPTSAVVLDRIYDQLGKDSEPIRDNYSAKVRETGHDVAIDFDRQRGSEYELTSEDLERVRESFEELFM
jgi:hypothetical protein